MLTHQDSHTMAERKIVLLFDEKAVVLLFAVGYGYNIPDKGL